MNEIALRSSVWRDSATTRINSSYAFAFETGTCISMTLFRPASFNPSSTHLPMDNISIRPFGRASHATAYLSAYGRPPHFATFFNELATQDTSRLLKKP